MTPLKPLVYVPIPGIQYPVSLVPQTGIPVPPGRESFQSSWLVQLNGESEILTPAQPMNPRKWQNDAELQPPFGSLAARVDE